ncbi:hypothetical protein MJO28_010513 [Puccinia striiformis f. sp. tritici]|uniref:Glycosyl transferase family 25 domain-containing protein n=3 Tax=Puccinia striiformis TaxID=27350 RepID=A0A0L0V2Z4_9BASI|nr:hypothetical protein Pst134EB_020219 [Puccinia striiformis f. sp. tritici]KAI9623538.1 hypothetical protein KEM48_009433 [Puccinia striiformis f. sp. tritici PST-130]KNE93668.1 hypothetical protein PSTG_12951 [Puccinia striiformis f. sp. tritici PST-78]POW16514.1 hypothetical protein PSTT_01285 [Puccinia striiformis]KAI7944818.1 hypothetical protein MJO28_010513 [Puccinia striiformis f. sp. tritici]
MFLKLSDNHTTPWLLIALFVSLTLFLTQLLPNISSTGSAFRYSYTTWPRPQQSAFNQFSSGIINDDPLTTSAFDLQAGLPRFSSIRVVSLKSRLDRRTHMQTLTAFLRLENLHFTDAVLYTDPRVLEIVKRVGNNTKADKKIAEVGHVACRMSHRMAIEAADADDDQVTLILEDDVDMEAAFKYLAGTILRDVPKDWDMIFFGHTDFSNEARNGPDPSTSNFYIYKSVEPQGGHGYALSRKGRKLILELLDNKRPEVYETDEGQPVDEIFMYLARLDRAKLYSVIPDLIVQVPLFKSDIFGTPAGFKDGMHNKKLLDSSLNRIALSSSTPAPQPAAKIPITIVHAPRTTARRSFLST